MPLPDNRSAVMVVADAVLVGTNTSYIPFEDMTACHAAEDDLDDFYTGQPDRPRYVCIPTEL